MAFSFEFPSDVLYGESEKATFEAPIVERDAQAVSAAASALAQIKELMSLPYEQRTALITEREVQRLEQSLTAAEVDASRAVTMAGTPLYHNLLLAPEIMRNVLSYLEGIDLVNFGFASKECARQALYLAPAADWDFVGTERGDLLIYLKEELGWFGGLDLCQHCENMMMHSLDLGDLCDVCAEEYEADIRAHQPQPRWWEEEDSDEEDEEKREGDEEKDENEE